MVSIVMTVYNVGEWLEKAISSCLGQTYRDIELVLVEDCSSDNSLDIIEEYLAKDERIRLVKNAENLGAGASRRVGIEHAKGEFVITVDGDDYISEDYIEALVRRQEETGADIVGGGITIVYANGMWECKCFGERLSEGPQKLHDYSDGSIIFLNTKIVRRSLYDIVPYSTRRYVEDTPVIVPLLYYANKVAYCNHAGYFYNQRGGSLCHTADLLRNGVFKGLCAAELLDFFSDKEGYEQTVRPTELFKHVKMVKDARATKEDIEPFKAEFIDLMLHFLKHINFN